MIYGYKRVSTISQQRDGNSLDDQEVKLREHGAIEIYADAFTGTKMDRPQFKELLSKLETGDTLVVTKLDRLSRSASQGIELIDALLAKGVNVHIINMGMMDNTPTGKLIRNIMLSFAEFERDMIVERTQEGKAVARQRADFKEGRPKTDEAKLAEALEMLATKTYAEVARLTGISKSTLIRAKKRAS